MALRNHPESSAATRQRVQALADQMGYRSDPMLSALSAYRHGLKRVASVLAFVTTGDAPDRWKTAYGESLFTGARQEARRRGYELTGYWFDPAVTGARHSRILEARGIAGLLIAPLAAGQTSIGLEWDRFPVVALGHTLRSPRLPVAMPDQYGGLLLACRELEARGYRRIGLATSAESDAYIDGQWSAAMLKYQSALPPSPRVKPLWDNACREAVFRAWLDRERPDVVIAYGHPHYTWLLATGRRVPRDIGFVLLSNYERSAQEPPFAALEHNMREVGAAGVALLHTQCITHSRGVPAVRVKVVVDATWVPGQTVREAPRAG